MTRRSYRALVLDDDQAWREVVRRCLTSADFEVDTTANPAEARRLVDKGRYDLIVLDISTDNRPASRDGIDLLGEFHRNDRIDTAVVIVLSGFLNSDRVREVMRYPWTTVVDKSEFMDERFLLEATTLIEESSEDRFLNRAQHALLTARRRAADHRLSRRSQLEVSVREGRFVSTELSGQQTGKFLLPQSARFNQRDYSRRADNLNLLVLNGRYGAWRSSARALGHGLYRTLMSETAIAETLVRARDLSTRNDPVVMQFTGPSEALRLPFELLADGNDYVCFDHVLIRRLADDGLLPTRKGKPFYDFIGDLADVRAPLRILLVGSNSDGQIPAVEEEVSLLHASITAALRSVGLKHQIDVLVGHRATYENIRDLLAQGNVHVFHYAGHGRFHDRLPEISGLLVRTNNGSRKVVSAAELKQLVSGTELRLVFLSCCVGARTADQLGRGDFHGTLDAVVRGGVPFVLGYRWVVPDREACTFAVSFYAELFESLSPGLSLLHSRRAASIDMAAGRHNSLWASPILVAQSPV